MLRVRIAAPEEEPLVRKLEKILNLEIPGLSTAETWLLDDGGKIIGMARITDLGPAYFLSSVGVIRERRGQGLASKLVRRLLRAKEKPVYLYTVIPGFFQRLWFAPCSPPPFLPPKNLFSCDECQPQLCSCLVWWPKKRRGSDARTEKGVSS